MDQDVPQARDICPQVVFELVSDMVALPHGCLAVDDQVQVDVVPHAGLADKALFGAEHAPDLKRPITDLHLQVVVGVLVHDLPSAGLKIR